VPSSGVTGSSFAPQHRSSRPARGLTIAPLLTRESLAIQPGGGLVLVGSYVKRSTDQLNSALELARVSARELSVDALLSGADPTVVAGGLAAWADGVIATGGVAIIYTSRSLVSVYARHDHVQVAALVSKELSMIAASLTVRPAWLIAKGGITSSDVATGGLGVRRARGPGATGRGSACMAVGTGIPFPGPPICRVSRQCWDAKHARRNDRCAVRGGLMLVTLHDLLAQAGNRGYALGAFNTYNLEITTAIVAAAEARSAPVIVQTGVGALGGKSAVALPALVLASPAPQPCR